MDNMYLLLIVLTLLLIGIQFIRFVDYFKKMLDLKREEQRMRRAEYPIKINRDNANLALQNDLRGFVRLFAKRFYPEKDPEKDLKKKYKICEECGERVKAQGYGGHLFLKHNIKRGEKDKIIQEIIEKMTKKNSKKSRKKA